MPHELLKYGLYFCVNGRFVYVLTLTCFTKLLENVILLRTMYLTEEKGHCFPSDKKQSYHFCAGVNNNVIPNTNTRYMNIVMIICQVFIGRFRKFTK